MSAGVVMTGGWKKYGFIGGLLEVHEEDYADGA